MSQTQDVYQAIYKNLKSSRSQKSFEALQQVCQEHFDAGGVDFKISTIAKLGASRGVPGVQTIRNKTGEHYRALLDAWKKLGEEKKQEKNRHITPAGKYDWVDRIADPSLRYLALDLIAQVKHLTSENRQLVSVTKLEIDCRTSSDRTIENKYPSFMDHEIDALKAAIDERFLEMQGWVKSDRGCIKDAQGKILFKNGWVNVIEKILSTNHGR